MGQNSSKTPENREIRKSSRDMKLIIPDETGNTHMVVVSKALLMEHSATFRELVDSGQLKKRKKKLKLQDVTLTGVLKILECLENGTVSFQNVNEISQTLQAAEKYQIDGIEGTCQEHLGIILNVTSACDVYEFSVFKEFWDVIYKCLKIIDEETESILKSDGFLKLKQDSVVDIVKRSSLSITSEKVLFDAVLEWGRAELKRQGQSTEQPASLKHVLQPILPHIRFSSMSVEDLEDALVTEYYPTSPKPYNSDFMLSKMSYTSDGGAADRNSLYMTRSYVSQYIHNLDVFDGTQAVIGNNESFCLTMEVLKGRVFFCGVNLALKKFSNRMNATCLYALLRATNTGTGEQKRIRGTFLDTTVECTLMFTAPLYLKDSDSAEIVINVKMAGNTAPLSRRNDVEIVVPPNKDIAMKILADTSSGRSTRCIFKDIVYFF